MSLAIVDYLDQFTGLDRFEQRRVGIPQELRCKQLERFELLVADVRSFVLGKAIDEERLVRLLIGRVY
jgi:hypothetical protein